MWSGPRNISTAMMRAWGNRADTAVVDEPLYAHYLVATGIDHPGRDDVIRHHEIDWRKAIATLLGPIPGGKPIYYQKHMAHHLLPQIERGWLSELRHAFLIREPREMLTSLLRNLPNPTAADTGLPQQLELLDRIEQAQQQAVPIVDSRDVLQDPRRMLTLLCDRLGAPFDEAMLRWPAGRRATDGVWAPHWYAAVEKSTTFEPYRPKDEPVPPRLASLLRELERDYVVLHARRLR